jgi:hypothetical protein
MIALIFLALNLLAGLVKSNSRLEAENAAFRQQLIGLQRKVRGVVAHLIPAGVTGASLSRERCVRVSL